MNFKTPISTTREQSERLLALGVKPETADMCYNLYFASAPPEINNYGADLYKDKIHPLMEPRTPAGDDAEIH